MPDVLVQVEKVGKKFCRDLKRSLWYGLQDSFTDLVRGNLNGEALRKQEFWANSGLSFELKRGECMGIIGRNGAGKTTVLKMLSGLIKPDTGRITIRGRVGALIALGAGFNPVLTGRENIYINASILGLQKQQTDRILDDIIDFSEIEAFIDTPVQSYSSGMKVRLGFAIASRLRPDIFLIDEVLAVGDHRFKLKAADAIRDAIRSGTAVAFVSHNLHEVSGITENCIWMDQGRMRYAGPTDVAISNYLDQQSRSNSLKPGLSYSPKRSGLVTATKVAYTTSGNCERQEGAVSVQESGAEVKIYITLDVHNRIDHDSWHAFNLRSQGGHPVGRAVIERPLNLTEGKPTELVFKLTMPHLLAGQYHLEYYTWIKGGVMLEGVSNLLEIKVLPETARAFLINQFPLYATEKMADSETGAIPLDVIIE